jgi:hypothetical protein
VLDYPNARRVSDAVRAAIGHRSSYRTALLQPKTGAYDWVMSIRPHHRSLVVDSVFRAACHGEDPHRLVQAAYGRLEVLEAALAMALATLDAHGSDAAVVARLRIAVLRSREAASAETTERRVGGREAPRISA